MRMNKTGLDPYVDVRGGDPGEKPGRRSGRVGWEAGGQWTVGVLEPQQRLYLRPLPHGHGSLRPILRPSRRKGAGHEALARDRRCGSK